MFRWLKVCTILLRFDAVSVTCYLSYFSGTRCIYGLEDLTQRHSIKLSVLPPADTCVSVQYCKSINTYKTHQELSSEVIF